jgi:hypothetical protein
MTFLAMHVLLLEEFYEHSDGTKLQCDSLVADIMHAWRTTDRFVVSDVSSRLQTLMKKQEIREKLEAFVNTKAKDNPTVCMVKNYLDMVKLLLAFTRSARDADWELRLASLREFTKYLFALDLRSYAMLITWQI